MQMMQGVRANIMHNARPVCSRFEGFAHYLDISKLPHEVHRGSCHRMCSSYELCIM